MSTKTSSPQTALYKALTKANAEILHCAMDGVNPAFRSKYSTLEAVLTALKPVLAKHGLGFMQMPLNPGEVRTVVFHEDGGRIVFTTRLGIKSDKAHDVGSGITYAKRYALVSFFGMTGDPDDDGNAATSSYTHTPKTEIKAPNSDPKASSRPAELLALGARNGWSQVEIVKAIQKMGKSSTADLDEAEFNKLKAVVSAYSPKDILDA